MKKILLLMLAVSPLAGFAQGKWFLNAKLGGNITTSHPREEHWLGASGVTTVPQFAPSVTLGTGVNLGKWQIGGNLETGVMRAGIKIPGYSVSHDLYIPEQTMKHRMPYAALIAFGNRCLPLKGIDLYAGMHIGGMVTDNAGNSLLIDPGTYWGVAGGLQMGVIKKINNYIFFTAEVGARQVYLFQHRDERVVDDYIIPEQTLRFRTTTIPVSAGIGFRL